MPELNGDLNPAMNLNGSLTDASALAGSLNLDDNITGSLTGEHVLNGSLTPTSTMSGLLGVYGEGGTSDYNELDNKPSINNVTLQGNKTTEDLGLFSGDYNDLTNKPTIPDKLSDLDVTYYNLQSGDTLRYIGEPVNGWENAPFPNKLSSLSDVDAPVPQNGHALIYYSDRDQWIDAPYDYRNLTHKPTIPEAQVNSDWNSTSGVAEILNKPTLATVATSGSYDDLTNKPTIPAAQVNSDWNATSGVAEILNKPTIPAAQVNSDWNATSGVAEILNKPTLATVATSGSYNDLSDKPTIPTDFYIPYRNTETQIGTWLDGITPVYQKYIDLGGTKTLAPNTNVNLAPLPGDILLLGGGCIRIDTTYTGYFPYIQLVANGTYLQGNNIRSNSVGINAVLIQYVYRS